MAERKYFVLCEHNCKFESMTKEQILTAINNAIETGEIKDVDAGFITTIKERNKGAGLSFWVGTTAEFNAITKKVDGCYYIITDDTTISDVDKAIEGMRAQIEEIATVAAKAQSEVAGAKAYADRAASTAVKYYEKKVTVTAGNTEYIDVFTIPNFDAKKQMILLFYTVTLSGFNIPLPCVGKAVFDNDDTTAEYTYTLDYYGRIAPDPTVCFTYDGKVKFKDNTEGKDREWTINFAVVPIEKNVE